MRAHDELVEEARVAIQAVHGDSSVSQQKTVESLDELIDEATMLRDVVQGELDSASHMEMAVDGDATGDETLP